jgi:hypothetical protein
VYKTAPVYFETRTIELDRRNRSPLFNAGYIQQEGSGASRSRDFPQMDADNVAMGRRRMWSRCIVKPTFLCFDFALNRFTQWVSFS